MKKTTVYFFGIILLCFANSFSSTAQLPLSANLNNCDLSLSRNWGHYHDAGFYLLGDGCFSNNLYATHHYNTSGTYTPQAWFVERYKPTRPQKAIAQTVNIPTCRHLPPRRVNMNGRQVKVGESWMASPDNELIYIMTIENPTNQTQNGSVSFFYNANEMDLNPAEPDNVRYYNNLNWFTNYTQTSHLTNQRELSWDFQNLAPYEQRNIFVFMEIFPTTTSITRYAVKYDDSGEVVISSSSSTSSRLARYPHDPNTKQVINGECLLAEVSEQTIEYTIHFHNDGEAPATDVVVIDELSDYLNPNTLEMTQTPSALTQANFGQTAIFEFPDINLPGLNQSSPDYIYTYDETCVDFSFQICTAPNLSYDTYIKNTAQIYFPYQEAVETEPAVLYVEDCVSHTPLCNSPLLSIGNQQQNSPMVESLSFEKASLKVLPNPVVQNAQIAFELPDATNIDLMLMDNTGRVVTEIVNHEFLEKGHHQKTIFTENLNSGIYFLCLKTNNEIITKRIMVVH